MNCPPAMKAITCAIALFSANDAFAKDFSFGGRVVSCKQAAVYRDNELFIDFANAVDNFDATREQRINATLAALRLDVQTLTKDMDTADSLKRRRIAVAVAGVVLGEAAGKISTVGVKAPLSQVEKKALGAVAGRGGEWTTIFLKYGTTGDVDVTGMAVMPMTLLLSFSPYGVAERAWSLGNAAIDIASAVAEAEIIKGEAKLTATMTTQRAEALARKLQMPRIQEVNRLKNEIDKQCG